MKALDRKTAPVIRPFGRLEMPSPVTETLPNGIKLHTYAGGEAEVNRLTVMMEGGAVEWPEPGLPRFAAMMAPDGTISYTGAEIASTLEFNGSWHATDCTGHTLSHKFYSLNSRLPQLLPVMREVALNPVFPEQVFTVAREKSAKACEIQHRKVMTRAFDHMMSMAFGSNTPMGRSVTPEIVRSYTLDVVRSTYAQVAASEGTNVFLAGKITPQIHDMVADCFSQVPSAAAIKRVPIVLQQWLGSQREEVRVEAAVQAAMAAGIPAVGRTHSDFVTLRQTVLALGGYFGSRLNSNIREDKGYTYGINASLLGFKECSLVSISTQCDPAYTERVIDEVHAELLRMHNPASYTAHEIASLKAFIASQLAEQLDSPFTITDHAMVRVSHDTPPDYYQAQQDSLEALTPELLAEMSRKYLDPSKLLISIAR